MDSWQKQEYLRMLEQMLPPEREAYLTYLVHEIQRLTRLRQETQDKLALMHTFLTRSSN